MSDFITSLIRTKYRGAWASDYPYSYKDSCTHDGSVYFCEQANTNQEPPNASYWTLMVSKGDTGTGLGTHEATYSHAQLHANATDHAVGDSIAASIVDADLTHSPDGNSVFDALAGKAAALGADDNYVTDAEKAALHAANADTDLDATFEAAIKNTDNHTSGSTNKVFTATEQTKLAGITFSGLAKITVDITEPSTPSAGDLWIDTN